MAQSNSGEDANVGYSPDFELSHRDVIHEDNWREWEAKGFFVTMVAESDAALAEELALAQDVYGVEHVYTGDCWSYEVGQPLRHKPGTGIYVHPDGLENVAKWRAKHFPDEHQLGGPAAS